MRNVTDEQIAAEHGDSQKWPIKLWRQECASGETDLEYIDWRADKLFCSMRYSADRSV